jgi:hypothetical protein
LVVVVECGESRERYKYPELAHKSIRSRYFMFQTTPQVIRLSRF